MDIESDPSKVFIKVSASSNVKAVAGKIAHSCREAGDPPAILTIGPACINTAVKAIAIARGWLNEEGIELTFQPAFRDNDRTKPSVALYLATQKDGVTPLSSGDNSDRGGLSVSGHSNPPTVAGALAGRIRELKEASITAIGVDAVTNAVLAIGNARLYLEQDRMDIRAHPIFVHVTKEGRELNALRFVITSQSI